MKKLISVLLLFNFIVISAQNKEIYIYKSFKQFENNTPEHIGTYEGHESNLFGFSFFFIENGKKRYYKINKSYWGFRIGDYIFRTYKHDALIPLFIMKKKEKVFYLHGELALSQIRKVSSLAWGHHGIFYSDDFESKVYQIAKIVDKEKNNKALKSLCDCIKEQKKRFGDQARFSGYKDCVENFGETFEDLQEELQYLEEELDEGF